MSKNVKTVILSDVDGKLQAAVFASSPQTCQVSDVPDFFSGRAVKLEVGDAENENGWVVRSVLAGKRRKIEVLFGSVPKELAQSIPGFASVDENSVASSFESGSTIWLTDVTVDDKPEPQSLGLEFLVR